MKRGEIYYIKNDHGQIGHEIMKDRPAIIVSNDGYNEKAGMVTVVYLTRTPREDLLTHVTIRSTGRTSEALCEQITTVSAARVNRYMGTATPDEMRRVEAAIQIHLAMTVADPQPAPATTAEPEKPSEPVERDAGSACGGGCVRPGRKNGRQNGRKSPFKGRSRAGRAAGRL